MAKTPQERSAALRLRYTVLVEQMSRFAAGADHGQKTLEDPDDARALHFVAFDGKDAAGAFRIHWGGSGALSDPLRRAYGIDRLVGLLRPDEICIADRLVVAEPYRSGALVERLALAAAEFVERNQVQAMLLACEPHQLNRNLAWGFRPLDLTYSYPEVGLVVVLLGIVRDADYLEKIASPLARIARVRTAHDEKCVEGLRAALPAVPAVDSPLLDSVRSYRRTVLRRIHAPGGVVPEVFSSPSARDVARLIERSNIIRCRKPCLITSAWGTSRTPYVLLAGTVERAEAGTTLELGPGACLARDPRALGRSHSISALTPVELLALHESVAADLARLGRARS